MTKKAIKKQSPKKTTNANYNFNKKLSDKLHSKFSGIKTKNLGDGMMEISIK